MFHYKPCKRDFILWLNSSTLIGGEKVLRKEWIPWFHRAIERWMNTLGYTMNESWKQSPLILAKWLYCVHVVEVARQDYMGNLYYDEPNHRDTIEDKDRFETVVSFMEIEKFMGQFDENEDLCYRGKAGQRTQIDLAEFLYCHINVKNSKQGHYVTRILDANASDSDEDDAGVRSNMDNYVADSAEGWHY